MFKPLILFSVIAGMAQPLLAAEITFSSQEKAAHDRNISFVADRAASCLQDTWDTHVAFYNTYGVSKFNGDRNAKLDSRSERVQALSAAGAPTRLVDELEATSCIGLTLTCLGQAFDETGDPQAQALWKRIDSFVRANGVSGVFLINALGELGWDVLYWNPDPSSNAKWDAEDPKLQKGKPVTWNSPVKDSKGRSIYNPVWGMHESRYQSVMKNNMYYITPVDDKELLVGFGTKVPQAFTRAPFFVGVAHAGYHVFPGLYGQVIEAHSTRALHSKDNLEKSEFNPLGTGGGPRWTNSEKYRSGVIAVPPGSTR